MKRFIHSIAAVLCLVACGFAADRGPKSLEGSRPNIVFILTDDQGMGDLSCMGNTILRTPNIDRIYEQATRFTDFQVSPTCSPTRAAILSGRYPFEVGVSHTIMQRDRLAPAVVTFPQALQKAGYQTGLFGKWHLGDGAEYLPQKRGFDEVLMHGAGGIGQYGFGDFKENANNKYFDNVLLHNDTIVKTKGFCTDVFFNAALSWIKTQHDRKRPFFTYISLNAPHGPLIAPEKYKKRFLDEGYDQSTAARYGMIENIDDNVGILMQKLNDWNALENTLVIFMTDNGMAMKNIGNKHKGRQTAWNAGMKGTKDTNWEGGTHVPAFWYWKGVLGQGVDISNLTAHIDLYRTFCDLAGAEIPESALPPKGRSLLPLLEDSNAEWADRTIFSHRGRWGGGGRGKATRAEARYYGASVRNERWRLVFEMDSKEAWLSDISTDLGETKSLIGIHREVAEEMKKQFDNWWDSTEPYLINKGLPRIAAGEHHLQILYEKQLREKGIPEWAPEARPLSTVTAATKRSAAKPNIIYILLDEWGYFESSMMGHPILDTPNIDQLASEGMRFTQFLAGASVCAPTRSTLMTGQHTGHTTVRGPGCLRADDVTIANNLKDVGYATGGFGKWGLGEPGTTGVPEKHGFDTFFGYYNQTHAHSYYPNYLIRNSKKVPLEGNTGNPLTGKINSHDLIYADSLKFIRENKDRPFFAYLPWTPPHGHWGMPLDDPAWQKYKDKQWEASNQKGKQDAQMYAAMVEMVDRQIGEIMALLKQLKIDHNTIIFLSGDNGGKTYFANEKHPHGFLAPNLSPKTGERFRGGKGNFYEGGIRIPFIVRWPGKIEAGSVSDYLGYFPDVMPTIAEIAGAIPRNDTDGISIVPTLFGAEKTGREQEQHEYLYWENKKSIALRMNQWKAIGPAKGTPFELYDLSKDIEELHDVAAQYPEIIEKMKRYAKEAHTPVRVGKVLDASLGFKGHNQN